MSVADETAFYVDLVGQPGITHQDKQYAFMQTLTADRRLSINDLRILNGKPIRLPLMQPEDI